MITNGMKAFYSAGGMCPLSIQKQSANGLTPKAITVINTGSCTAGIVIVKKNLKSTNDKK
jgi:hypothetical protein